MIITSETAEKYADRLCHLRTKREIKELIKLSEGEIMEYKKFLNLCKKKLKSLEK